MKNLFLMVCCGVVLLTLSSCGREKRDFYMQPGTRLEYEYTYKMNYSPEGIQSASEPKNVEGKFVLIGGKELPISDNEKINITAQEIKLSFIPKVDKSLKEKSFIPQPEASVQILPVSGDMKVVWGIPPFDTRFLFMHFGEDKLGDTFLSRFPIDSPWIRQGTVLENIPLKRYHPTPEEKEKFPYYKKYDGWVYEYSQQIALGGGNLAGFHVFSKLGFKVLKSDVKLEGEIIVNPKTRRILRRRESQVYVYAMEGYNPNTGTDGIIRIDRGESRLLELIQD